MKDIKQYFFAHRDGLTADVLRRGGIPHKTIFGLQLPQLTVLARRYDHLSESERMALAERLWSDDDVRESRLLACCLFPPALMDSAKASALQTSVRSREEADLLRFKVLRKTNAGMSRE